MTSYKYRGQRLKNYDKLMILGKLNDDGLGDKSKEDGWWSRGGFMYFSLPFKSNNVDIYEQLLTLISTELFVWFRPDTYLKTKSWPFFISG